MRFSRTLHLAELNFKSSSILVLRQISFITDLIDADLPAGGATLPACCEMVQATPLLRRDWRKMPKHEPTSYELLGPGARCISKARRKGTIHRCHTSS